MCLCMCVYVFVRPRVRARARMCACPRAYVCARMRVRGLLEKYPTFGREKETGLLGALDT